jgi:hypothetical protein
MTPDSLKMKVEVQENPPVARFLRLHLSFPAVPDATEACGEGTIAAVGSN